MAADFHASRREMALKMGAETAIDPREVDPYGSLPDVSDRRINLIYESVGQRGMLARLIAAAPFDGRIVMGGWACHRMRI
ncbi:zinc-binding dehydrogenase [Novosphingobium sp.]|uniref:zinc-binding dehydrogenase n=1 Tax=Novosphingobium sp. TaxID=1874826 RepID=UPI002634EC42|nr:zinc-binding dehydrogenase [Novosphingobium sp.]